MVTLARVSGSRRVRARLRRVSTRTSLTAQPNEPGLELPTGTGIVLAVMRPLFGDFVQRLRQSGRYPHMVQMIDEGVDPDAPDTRDERFEFGLDCLLDGVMAQLSATPRPGRALRAPGHRADT